MFEEKPASTLSAGSHYTWALEDSDVCIFLIDNYDGIPEGVQVEIDTVKKYGIKALYYFCSETSKEKTPLELSLMGAKFSKSRTVEKFDELSSNSAQALINDIVDIYHYYCIGKLNEYGFNDDTEIQGISLKGTENLTIPTMPKTILKNVDKCKSYILEQVTGQTHHSWPNEPEKTSEIDESVFSNIDVLSLKIGLLLLYTAMGKETYSEILEIIPYLGNDLATTNSVINLIVEYLYTNKSVLLPKNIEIIILQNVLYWLRLDNINIRWCATRIMFALLRNPENKKIINNQLTHLKNFRFSPLFGQQSQIKASFVLKGKRGFL